MKYPLRIVIHIVQRKTIDFRQTMLALQCSLPVDQSLPFFGYDLSPPLRPAKTERDALVAQSPVTSVPDTRSPSGTRIGS